MFLQGGGVGSPVQQQQLLGSLGLEGPTSPMQQQQQQQLLGQMALNMQLAAASASSPTMSPPLSPTGHTGSFGRIPVGLPNHPMPLSPGQYEFAARALSAGQLSPTPLSPHGLPISPQPATSPGQGYMSMGQGAGGQRILTVNLERYVPPQTNPSESREENNFRHALPPRMLHKHKAWLEQRMGQGAELVLNIPPGMVELSRKRLSRGDSRYKGLADMKLEARVTGEFDPKIVREVLDEVFVGNKRTIRCSRRRCFEVINSVKSLTETTGAFVISRPVDECIDIYGPQHAVDAAQAYLTSMQSQSGVSKRVVHVKSIAASAIIRQRRNILNRDEGSLFVEPPPRGSAANEQTVTIYAYSDPGKLDNAERVIRDIEQEVLKRKGTASSDGGPAECMSPPMYPDSPPLSPTSLLHVMAGGQNSSSLREAVQLHQQLQAQHAAQIRAALMQQQQLTASPLNLPAAVTPVAPVADDTQEDIAGEIATAQVISQKQGEGNRDVSPPPLMEDEQTGAAEGAGEAAADYDSEPPSLAASRRNSGRAHPPEPPVPRRHVDSSQGLSASE